MTRLPAARFDEALAWWQLHSCFWGGVTPVRLGSWAPHEIVAWKHGPRADLAATVRWLDEQYDDEILIGMPQSRVRNGGVGVASMLWVRVDGREQLARANRFRPRPSIVFSEGASRRLCFWPLERAASYFDVVAANRRIAYALGAVQKHGDPDGLWFCAPGTCVRDGRARPVPVRVARLSVGSFELEAVVRGLKVPPEPAKWWEAGRTG